MVDLVVLGEAPGEWETPAAVNDALIDRRHLRHASTILKDKAHATMEGEKPWHNRADPDRAESRMAS
ncbi:hypothetical protein [Acidithiobacillus sp.]